MPMNEDTDTAIFERWQRYEATANRSSGQRDIELEQIEIAFERLIERRRQHELTDPARLDAVSDLLHGLVAFMDAKPSFYIMENMPSNPEKFSWVWIACLVADPLLATSKWLALVERAEAEVRQIPFSDKIGEPRLGAFNIDEGKFLELPPGEEVGQAARDLEHGWRDAVAWPVDTMVWEGPLHLRQQLRKNWTRR